MPAHFVTTRAGCCRTVLALCGHWAQVFADSGEDSFEVAAAEEFLRRAVKVQVDAWEPTQDGP